MSVLQKKWHSIKACGSPLTNAESLDSTELFRNGSYQDQDQDFTRVAASFAYLNEAYLPGDGESCRYEGKSSSHPTNLIAADGDTVITFSHFLPRQELLPEKRFLVEPFLSSVVGSVFLENQIRRLMPDLHLFGHSHTPIDLVLDGIRYVQWPLGYSREARMQCAVVRARGPLCVYDTNLMSNSNSDKGPSESSPNGIVENTHCTRTHWSSYYRQHDRDPAIVGPLAPWYVSSWPQILVEYIAIFRQLTFCS